MCKNNRLLHSLRPLKILLVTGRRAARYVNEVKDAIERDFGIKVDVLVLDYPVAALMSTRYIAEQLKKVNLNWSEYDVILIPGLSQGSAGEIREVTKTKVRKGTTDIYDLPQAIELLLKGIDLSEVDPADKLIRKRMSTRVETREAFEVNGLKVPLRSPPFLIFIELDSNKLSEQELERVREHVDVPILGFPSGVEDYDLLRRTIRTVSDRFTVFGIDSDSPKVMNEAVKLGASFVLNLTKSNLEELEVDNRVAYVVAPEDPGNVEELRQTISHATRRGFRNLVIDPILNPPPFGLVDSLVNYKILTGEFRNYPFMMGVLNVTELIDADSVGMNALLTAIALELGVSILLTREGKKTRWSSFELRRAVEMATASGGKRFIKDLGVDLLILKEKNRKVDEIPEEAERVAASEPQFDAGFVRVLRGEEEIAVEWVGKERLALRGTNGLYLARELVRRVKVSPEHAAYIGYELAKAEIALVLDKTYIQDAPLFPNAYKGSPTKPEGNKG